MPIYEYRCNHCGTISEFLVGVSSKRETLTCKQCGSPQLEKVISVSHPLKGEKKAPGHTCCGREERCATPPLLHGRQLQTGLKSWIRAKALSYRIA